MPISPQIVAEKRVENTVNKLCDLIDKKLQESEDSPFEFRFLPNTSPQVETAILEIYRNVGWVSSVRMVGDEHTLVLQHPNNATQESDNTEETTLLTVGKNRNRKNTPAIAIVEDAIGTIDGRIRLAQAMVEPIVTSLIYQSPTRKFLMTDELSVEALPRYTYGEHGEPFYYASDRTIKPYSHECLEDWVEFAALVDIDKEDIANRRFYVIDRAQVRLKDSIERQETLALMQLLQASITSDEQVIHTYGETLHRAVLETMGEMESQEMIAAKTLCHPRTYRRMCYALEKGSIDEATQRDILMTGLYGHLHSSDIHLSVMAPENEIYMAPPAVFVGTLSLPQGYLQVNPCTDENGNIGFLAKQKCMPIMLNPSLVRKIKVRW